MPDQHDLSFPSPQHRWASGRTAWVRRVSANRGQDGKKLKSDSYRRLYPENEMTVLIGDTIKGGGVAIVERENKTREAVSLN